MPINISKALRAKLPEDERANVDQALWDKSGGLCWLCEEPLNRSADDIHADHEIPEADGGPTELANLNLAHAPCNKAKRNAKTVPIRPYLKLLAYTHKNGGRLKYDGYLNHFGISPKPVVFSRAGEDNGTFELPDRTVIDVPIFSETTSTGTYLYTYLTLPRDAIFNDDECQPRVVRTDHAWSIYADMQRNVLHEPPSCRLAEYTEQQPVRLLLFDGQHKTIASWMLDRKEVTAKVYLNMTTAQANELVNSIQAKIKKLPLSPFELAGKMADEWENKFGDYENQVGATEVSEDGFLKWLPQTERSRAKAALHSALIQSVLSSPDLRITAHVKRPGSPAMPFHITEQQLKTKVLEKLLAKDPQTAKGEAAQRTRDAESANIVAVLNMFNDLAFESADDDAAMTDVEVERARRMTYQSSLIWISGLIRRVWDHTALTSAKQPMSALLNDKQWTEVASTCARLVKHPVWTAAFDRDDEMKAVKVALEKNQDFETAFQRVGFNFEYAILGKDSDSYKSYWDQAP